MTDLSLTLTILYVSDTARSAAFYTRLTGADPVEASPGFALFAFKSGSRLGLWRRDTVTPAVSAPAGAGEIDFLVADKSAVEVAYQDAVARGDTIAQVPMQLDFGFSTVLVDPDGHRVRIYQLDQ